MQGLIFIYKHSALLILLPQLHSNPIFEVRVSPGLKGDSQDVPALWIISFHKLCSTECSPEGGKLLQGFRTQQVKLGILQFMLTKNMSYVEIASS